MQIVDTVIIGAGAAGLMCAIHAGQRGRNVLVLDHANKPGKKILMSGGGRCNFTNYQVTPANFISHNPHFCKSALSRYTPNDFIELVNKHAIPFHEKTLGQLFCDHKSKDILDMLLMECELVAAEIRLNTSVIDIQYVKPHHFKIKTSRGDFHCQSLVVATGGLSIPTMGASPFGYQLAEQFGIKVWPTRAGLVPFTWHQADKEKFAVLSGVSFDAMVSNESQRFREQCLFTHRGLSGPAILQLSSYWQPGEVVTIDMLPEVAIFALLKAARHDVAHKNKLVKTFLSDYLAKKLIDTLLPDEFAHQTVAMLSDVQFHAISKLLHTFSILPNGTEGYRTAEVTLGGVDCDAISSKTMEVLAVPGLYFIGEVLDVTGWLGGYNFQWAWASGYAAGQVV